MTNTTVQTTESTFHFRPVKGAKLATKQAEFEAAGKLFENIIENDKVVAIKRKAEKQILPVLVPELFTASFVQGLIDAQVETVARKEFVDQYKDVDLDVLTASFVEQQAASQRTSAVPTEIFKALAAAVGEYMQEKGVPAATIKVVTTLVEGKCAKRVLRTYRNLEEQFVPVLNNVEMVINALDQEEQAIVLPAFAVMTDNVAAWFEAGEEEEVIELSLM